MKTDLHFGKCQALGGFEEFVGFLEPLGNRFPGDFLSQSAARVLRRESGELVSCGM